MLTPLTHSHCPNRNHLPQLNLLTFQIFLHTAHSYPVTIDKLKYIGFGNQSDTCMYFENCFLMPEATKNPHFLFDYIQFSRTQAGIKLITFNIDGVATSFMADRSYCSGVKVCAGERCTYSVSTKQRVNHCTEHNSMALIPSGPCTCYITYPRNVQDDRNLCGKILRKDNHPLPPEWKISPKVGYYTNGSK